MTAANASSSRSKTRAGPRWRGRSWPAVFTTHPSGARLPKNRQAAGGSQRRREWAYHLLRGCLFRSDSVLGPGGPICGARLAVEELTGDQPLSHQARASRPIEIHRDEPAAGFQVCKQRGTPTDPVEILELERKLGLPRNRQQVEDRVGGTAGSRHTGNRVLE